MRTGSLRLMAQGQQPIKSLGFLGWETTNLGLSPAIFVDLFSLSRGKLPRLEFTQKDYCPALQDTRGFSGDRSPSAYRGSSGQFPEWLTFYVSDL